MRNEDYGRIWRTLSDGLPVTLEFNIINRTYPLGRQSYNAIAEIPGTDKRDEVVMLGGHLDSWHSATGATDNAVGCAAMMEAARILKAIGVKPRRTIRGSSASQKPSWDEVDARRLATGRAGYRRTEWGLFPERPADHRSAGSLSGANARRCAGGRSST